MRTNLEAQKPRISDTSISKFVTSIRYALVLKVYAVKDNISDPGLRGI